MSGTMNGIASAAIAIRIRNSMRVHPRNIQPRITLNTRTASSPATDHTEYADRFVFSHGSHGIHGPLLLQPRITRNPRTASSPATDHTESADRFVSSHGSHGIHGQLSRARRLDV